MACNVQDWSLKDLTDALNNKHIDKKRIAVPMFQRGTRWQRSQEEKFIDSLKSGFPVGTMLFYETIEDNQSVYLLVDGLQRGNTIRKYITKPTVFFSSETISDEICSKLLLAMGEVPSIEGIEKARTILTEFIKAQQSYANLQYFNPAVELLNGFGKAADVSLIGIVDDTIENIEEPATTSSEPKKTKVAAGARPVEKAIERLQTLHPELGLVKKTARACVDANGVGYYFVHSKAYKKGADRLYWYGYRREPLSVLDGCSKIVLCYVLADEGRIVMLPQDEIESRTGAGGLNRSPHEDGSSHWHIKFIRDGADSVTWLAGPEGTGEKVVLNNVV